MHEKLRIISGREEYESMSKDEKVCQSCENMRKCCNIVKVGLKMGKSTKAKKCVKIN